MGETQKRRTRLRNLTTPYETARNAASHSAPKTRTPARLNRSDASMSAVVQLPHRIQMTLAAERGNEPNLMEVRVRGEDAGVPEDLVRARLEAANWRHQLEFC